MRGPCAVRLLRGARPCVLRVEVPLDHPSPTSARPAPSPRPDRPVLRRCEPPSFDLVGLTIVHVVQSNGLTIYSIVCMS